MVIKKIINLKEVFVMKKIKILMLLVMVVLLCACSSKKEAIDEEKFINIMKSQKFDIVNVEEQFEQYEYIEESYVALESNKNYQIEFYELENNAYAKSFYDNNKEIFEATQTNSSFYTNVDLTNSNRYTLTTDTEYKVLSRIDETVIYVNADKKYKNEITNILKKLGY